MSVANEGNLKPFTGADDPRRGHKPKGVPHSKTRLKRLLELTENLTNPVTGELEGFSVAEQMDLAQIIKARKGDTQAYNSIFDRLEGKPQQSISTDLTINPARDVLEAAGLLEINNDRQDDDDLKGSSDQPT